jgi:hypothetical protein
MGCGGGGRPFVSMGLGRLMVGLDVKIYVHILRKKLNIYLPVSPQKRCNPFSFYGFGMFTF